MLNDPDYGQVVDMSAPGHDYENPKVLEISQKLGDFEYGTAGMPNGAGGNLEFKPMQILENLAKFEG